MSRILYMNGDYVPEHEAKVSVFDRGFLFGDAVYEVTAVVHGRLLDFEGHMARLRRSLGELGIVSPVPAGELGGIHRELIERNGLRQGVVYLQISRGMADRSFLYPADPEPTIVLFTQARELLDNPKADTGVRVISAGDLRWGRRDIKTVQLLYSSMAKMAAGNAGVDDAWMVEDGFVTEATSSNAFIAKKGTVITRPLGRQILPGVTRAAILRYAREAGLEVEERPFSIAEAKGADEAFMTSASTFVIPVVEIDGVAVGDGKPGPLARRLRNIYLNEIENIGS